MSTTQHDQTTEAPTNGTLSYKSVRDAVRDWPLSLRAALMHDILNTLMEQVENQEQREERRRKALSEMPGLLKTDKPAPSDEEVVPYGPKRNTVQAALGLAATDKPAPSDEDVERWLDERRMEKYG